MSDEETYARFGLLLDPDETIPEDLEPEVPKGYVRVEAAVLPDPSSITGSGWLETKKLQAIDAFERQQWADTVMQLDWRGAAVEDELARQARQWEPVPGFMREEGFTFDVSERSVAIVVFALPNDLIPNSIELKIYDPTQDAPGNYVFALDDGEGNLLIQQDVWINELQKTDAFTCVGRVSYDFGGAEIYFDLLPPVSQIQARFRIQEKLLNPTAFR